MRIDWWTLALQTINLVILLGLLGRFLFRPMAAMIAARQAEAARMLDDAKTAQAAAVAAQVAAAAEHSAATQARANALTQAHGEAEAQRAALLADAAAAIRQRAAEAATAAQRQHEAARAQLAEGANALAVDIAARLLAGPGGSLPVTAFLADLADALAALPAAGRAGLNGPLALVTARALAPDEEAAIRATLARALGQAPDLALSVDPALIAGLRLSAATVQVDANVRAGLDRVHAELDRHD